jgi:hypothetical protein
VDTIVHISHEVSATLCEEGHELTEGLTRLFKNFDQEHNNCLQDKDILSMVKTLSEAHKELNWFNCGLKESQVIATAIGGEEGKISMERWSEWFIRGARRPALERAKFASHSETFYIINTFLESTLIVIRKNNLLLNSATSKVAGYERASGRHTAGYGGRFGSKKNKN